jgi:hypothetical protein
LETSKSRVREWLDEGFEGQILLADGFDDALIGCAYSPGRGYVAVYETEKCVEILEGRGMTPEEAMEFFEFNVEGSDVGPRTPVYLNRPPQY